MIYNMFGATLNLAESVSLCALETGVASSAGRAGDETSLLTLPGGRLAALYATAVTALDAQ